MKTLKSIIKGQKFTDDDGEIWLFVDTIVFLEATLYVNVKFVFVSEDLNKSMVLNYYNVDDVLRTVLDS